jgi:hypothetical protein
LIASFKRLYIRKEAMGNKASAFLSLFLGIGLLAGAGYMFSDTRQLLAAAEKAPGVVVGFERRSSKGGSTEYPVIEFAAVSGEVRRFTLSGPGDYPTGAVVEVLYDAANPANARLNAFIELWLGSLALGGFGLLCLGVSIGTWFYERARLKTGEGKHCQ